MKSAKCAQEFCLTKGVHPTGFAADPAPPPLRKAHFLVEAVARIKPGITIAQAQSQVDTLIRALQKQFPND
ncbi:MAG TPA: hypothetical protein VND65_19135, partial [Candidatus Binatia bacterium]|nr:hypothetical protein [Candidatus Binatia bacterium]